MKRRAVICVAVVLVLAGCVGGQGGSVTSTTSAPTGAETTDATTVETNDGTVGSADGASSLNFYLSDEKNAMGDFAHLNVTVTKVGLKPAGNDANWTTYEVDERTIDLTRLRGANATRLGTFAVGNGTYRTVFVHVGEVNGTLKNGEQVRVKLPSQKLQIHQQFTVGPNQSVDYVFDISVFEAGKSGKYILKPVISESGTDEEIESVDEKKEDGEKDDEAEKDGKTEKDDGNETEDDSENETERTSSLDATFVGNVTRGENATVEVTRNGSAVANATVTVNGDVVGETQTDGTLTFSVPDRKELEVEVETENGSVTLTKHFEKNGGNGSGQQDGDGGNGNGD